MARAEAQPLRQRIGHPAAKRFFWDRAASARVTDLASGTSFAGRLGELTGKSVLVATASQLTSALALVELDGVARRLTILPPDTAPDHLGALAACAEADAVVIDDGSPRSEAFDLPVRVACSPTIVPADRPVPMHAQTEWVLLTSGTS